jgi:xanthine dehydrogenase molybdenum-binding subunit
VIEKGHVRNGNLTDYRLLRSPDAPRLDAVIVESHEPTGPFGAKGVGEGSMVCVASAVANAVYHAVGVRVRDLPITPEKVLAALKG